MSHSVRILSISDDDGLRYSRELLLEKDGYETESITSNTALSVSRVRSFDIAVICRSVDPERVMGLTDMLRRYNPDLQILCITPLENRLDSCAADLEIASGPETVLEGVRQLCSQRSMRNACYEASHHG
jgi:DNA-binding response OmpR family regulator